MTILQNMALIVQSLATNAFTALLWGLLVAACVGAYAHDKHNKS